MKGVAVGERRDRRAPRARWARGSERARNAGREIHETQSGTNAPDLVERLARMDRADLERLLDAVAQRQR